MTTTEALILFGMTTAQMADRVAALVLTGPQLNLLAAGFCPFCRQPIRGPFDPVPKGADYIRPEIYESLRELEINVYTGHKQSCSLSDLRLPK